MRHETLEAAHALQADLGQAQAALLQLKEEMERKLKQADADIAAVNALSHLFNLIRSLLTQLGFSTTCAAAHPSPQHVLRLQCPVASASMVRTDHSGFGVGLGHTQNLYPNMVTGHSCAAQPSGAPAPLEGGGREAAGSCGGEGDRHQGHYGGLRAQLPESQGEGPTCLLKPSKSCFVLWITYFFQSKPE